MATIFRRFRSGQPPLPIADLARELGVPCVQLAYVLEPLRRHRVLAEATQGGGLLPGRDAESVSIGQLWLWARGVPPAHRGPAQEFMDDLERKVLEDSPTVGAWLRGSEAPAREDAPAQHTNRLTRGRA
jgi:hypothetical protein